MANSIVPSVWLGAGFAASSGSHTITFNTGSAGSNQTLPQLLDAKADPSTGDVRQIAFAIADALYQSWLARGIANQTTDMRLSRSVSGDSSGNLTYEYRQQYTLTPGGIYSIPAEP
jgi:hypothetical protein